MTTTTPAPEQNSRHVVLTDTYGSSASALAPAFSDAGYIPIRVQSTPEAPEVFAGRPDPFPYQVRITHDGDLASTLAALAPFAPAAVVAGCEHGVELADALSEALHPITGAPTNGTALSSARRNKLEMIERIKAQGLRGARQIHVHSEKQLYDWHTRLGGTAIVKPLRSAANDGVQWCPTPEESVAAFRTLDGRTNALAEPGDGVVAQEYLIGAEYLVNTVSRDGSHHVCDIWKTHRISANGVADLLVACQLLPATGEVQDALVPYAFAVLDALGIRHGGAHVEIKLTPKGPCLIEVGARVAGVGLPGLTEFATGTSQIEWSVDAYVRPQRFRRRAGRPYRLRRHIAWALMVAPRSGLLLGYRDLQAIKELESFRDMHIAVHPGQQLSRTVDDGSYPITLTLAHDVDEVLLRDLATLRYLDGAGFYELAHDNPFRLKTGVPS